MPDKIVELADHRPPVAGSEKARIADWLHRVMLIGQWTNESLARAAEINPTTISRFRKHGYPVPKMATLAKIAEAAGVPAPDTLLITDTQPFVDVPIILPILAVTRGIRDAVTNSIQTTRAPSKFRHCLAVKITADTASLAGILPGDLVICDPAQKPDSNDLVVVALDTGLAGVYRVQESWLIPPALGNLPSLPLTGTLVLGVARQVQRELR